MIATRMGIGGGRVVQNLRMTMSDRFPEAVALATMQKNNRLSVNLPKAGQQFSWADALPIAEFTPNILFCHEQPALKSQHPRLPAKPRSH